MNSKTTKPGLHMTISASPFQSADTWDPATPLLANDLRLIKAALLYADRATLISPVSSDVFKAAMKFGQFSINEMNDLLTIIISKFFKHFSPGDYTIKAYLDKFERIAKHMRWGPAVTIEDPKFSEIMRNSLLNDSPDILSVFILSKTAEAAVAAELVSALNSGMIDLHSFKVQLANPHVMIEWVRTIQDTVLSSNTYPLFDDLIGGWVRGSMQMGKTAISEAGIARGKHSALAANLIERLPLFEQATVAEILDIRRELNDPLIRFRRGVLRFSEGIKTEPWDVDFAGEAQNVFMRDVEPAVQEIEEAVQSNRFLLQLMRKGSSHKGRIAAGVAGSPTLGILMSRLGELSQVASVSGAAGAAAVVAGFTIFEVLDEWMKQKQHIKQNDLFFYYRTQQSFSQLR